VPRPHTSLEGESIRFARFELKVKFVARRQRDRLVLDQS
jgi:hypothetical protein